jgi:uncharacterized Rmd1/YagE family protein
MPNAQSLFAGKPGLRARALLLGARLDLRTWPEAETLHRAPLAIKLDGGAAVLFRYGVAVLLGVSADAERALRERLAARIEGPYASVESEEIHIRIDAARPEGLQEGTLVVQSGTLERLLLVAEALAKSLVLSYYETRLAAAFDRIEALALELERTGGIRGNNRAHLKYIGAMLLIESRMVGRAEIGDRAELLWNHPELEGLNALLEDEFEIHERLAALDRKLELVARTEDTIVDIISTRHSLRVEWYIVSLIVLEILLTIYQLWLR